MNELSIFTTIVGVVIGGGGLVAFFGKSRGDSIIKYQAEEIQLRDSTIARLKEDNAALTSENTVLKAQITRYERLAQGSPQLVKMTAEIKALVEAVTKLTKSRSERSNGR
jgi:hypothetical protein